LVPVNGVSQMPTTGTPFMSWSRPWMMLMPNTSGTKKSDAVVSCSCSSSSTMRGCEPERQRDVDLADAMLGRVARDVGELAEDLGPGRRVDPAIGAVVEEADELDAGVVAALECASDLHAEGAGADDDGGAARFRTRRPAANDGRPSHVASHCRIGVITAQASRTSFSK
jgi:hypothetical protein